MSQTFMVRDFRPRSFTRPLTLNTSLFEGKCEFLHYNKQHVDPYPIDDYWMIGEKARLGAGKKAL